MADAALQERAERAAPVGTGSLLVFADDWGRHPSSCQHLVSRLLPEHRTCWVDTIGMRPPRLDLSTVRRAAEKFGGWLSRPQAERTALPPNLAVLNPPMWPWFRSGFDRSLNRRLLLRTLLPAVRDLPEPVTAVTTLPIVADLAGHVPVARWVYYCVDDFSQWPGLDRGPIERMERDLVARVDRTIAAGETLRRRLATMGSRAELITHGVDLARWTMPEPGTDSGTAHGASPLDAVLDGFEGPLVVFWGVIDRRMDREFVARLSADLNAGTIVLVGPANDPDPALFAVPRVRHVPPVRFEALPRLAARASVLVMPYADVEVTRAMEPLKLKEYLATGRPAVVRDLPATAPWSDCADTVASAESFSAAVRERIATGLPAAQRAARMRLAGEGWEAKARRFAEVCFAETISGPGEEPS